MSMEYESRLLEEATQPAEEPVSLAEAKLYLRVDVNDDDALIGQMIVTARRAAEHYLRRSLVIRQWRLLYDDAAPATLRLPMGPVSAVVSVTKIAEDGSTAAVNAALYRLNAACTELGFEQTVYAHRVEILYNAGYGAASAVPASIKQGMLAHLAEIYDGRSQACGLPDIALALYLPHREVRL